MNLTVTVCSASELPDCSRVDAGAFGSFVVPTRNLGQFLAALVAMRHHEPSQVYCAMAEEADRLCDMANIT